MWDTALKKVPEQWVTLAAPAIVFWAGALLVWASAGWPRLSQATAWLTTQTAIVHLAFTLGALTVVAASVVVVRRTTTPVLRLLEGYWPTGLDRLAARRRGTLRNRKARDSNTWRQLIHEWNTPPNPAQRELVDAQRAEQAESAVRLRAELARLEHRRCHRPVQDSDLMPTRIGNILRAAETRPGYRYGLDAVVVWPRLWLVLPDTARTELAAARAALDGSVAAAIWGIGFLAFIPWAWWAGPIGLVVAAAAVWWWVPARAEVFADLIEATYDLYRWELYQHLHRPLPDTPAEEPAYGQALTQYLERGSDDPHFKFTHTTPPETSASNEPPPHQD